MQRRQLKYRNQLPAYSEGNLWRKRFDIQRNIIYVTINYNFCHCSEKRTRYGLPQSSRLSGTIRSVIVIDRFATAVSGTQRGLALSRLWYRFRHLNASQNDTELLIKKWNETYLFTRFSLFSYIGCHPSNACLTNCSFNLCFRIR